MLFPTNCCFNLFLKCAMIFSVVSRLLKRLGLTYFGTNLWNMFEDKICFRNYRINGLFLSPVNESCLRVCSEINAQPSYFCTLPPDEAPVKNVSERECQLVTRFTYHTSIRKINKRKKSSMAAEHVAKVFFEVTKQITAINVRVRRTRF